MTVIPITEARSIQTALDEIEESLKRNRIVLEAFQEEMEVVKTDERAVQLTNDIISIQRMIVLLKAKRQELKERGGDIR